MLLVQKSLLILAVFEYRRLPAHRIHPWGVGKSVVSTLRAIPMILWKDRRLTALMASGRQQSSMPAGILRIGAWADSSLTGIETPRSQLLLQLSLPFFLDGLCRFLFDIFPGVSGFGHRFPPVGNDYSTEMLLKFLPEIILTMKCDSTSLFLRKIPGSAVEAAKV